MTRKTQTEPTSIIQYGMHDDAIESTMDAIKAKPLDDLTTRELLIADLHHDVRRHRRQLAEFMDNVSKDPAHAFEWGTSTVEIAQALRYSFGWLQALCHTSTITLTTMRDELLREITREARYSIMCSTSPMANLSKDAQRCVVAKLYERVDDALKAEQRKAGAVVHT